MELKLDAIVAIGLSARVLIVPYGIETPVYQPESIGVFSVLIVPYGIETTLSSLLNRHIHSFNRTLWN